MDKGLLHATSGDIFIAKMQNIKDILKSGAKVQQKNDICKLLDNF